MKLLKDPPPVLDGDYGDIVSFHHPGYPTLQSCLFRLPCVDRTTSEARPLGLHHGTALQACRIVAGNVDGHLSRDRQGEEPVGIGVDEILAEKSYYFWPHALPADGTPYPIVPSFKDWPFPHGAVPDSWKLPENHNPGVDRTRCIVTNRSAGLKKAHIVHREDGDWFRGRGMALYTIGPQGIDSSENLVNLRADLHNVYDAQDFVFVPKREIYGADADVDNTPAYVLHVLGADVHDIWAEFHNVRVQGIRHTMAEFHFVRFARSILLSVKQFIIQGYPRTVIRAREGGEGVATRLTGPGLERHYSGGGGENATCQSPRKRQRGEGVVDEMAEEGPQSSDTEGGSDYEGEESGARTPSGVAGTTTTKRGRSPSLPFEAGEWEPALEA